MKNNNKSEDIKDMIFGTIFSVLLTIGLFVLIIAVLFLISFLAQHCVVIFFIIIPIGLSYLILGADGVKIIGHNVRQFFKRKKKKTMDDNKKGL